MKFFSTIFLILFCTCCNNTYVCAQPVFFDYSALKKYPPSIVNRLQDIASKLQLDKEKIDLLASKLIREDSLITNAVLQNKSNQEISELRNNLQSAFSFLFSPAQRKILYQKEASQYADKEARAYAALLTQKLSLDKNRSEIVQTLLYKEKADLFLAYIHKKYDPTQVFDMMAVVKKYDSLKNGFFYAAEGYKYLQTQLATLNTIQPLAKNEEKIIKNIFTAMAMQKSDKAYADIFNDVLHKYIKDTVYYAALYKDDINRRTTINVKKTFGQLLRNNKITAAAADTLYALAFGKERTLAVLHYGFPVYTKYRDSLEQTYTKHYDSLINIALLKDGSFPIISSFSIAIKNRKQLALTITQTDSVLSKALLLEHMREALRLKDPMAIFDGNAFQATELSTILSEEQYLQLLAIKHRPQAEKWATDDWAELSKRGLTDGLTANGAINQIREYNINRLLIKDRYANDKIMQNIQIKAIDANIPIALRRLRTARGKDDATAVAQPAASNKNYKW